MLLGGNIELEGFDSLDPAVLVVVKKMVGSEAKKISDKGINFEKLRICLNSNSGSCDLSANLILKDTSFDVSSTNPNLFFGIDGVFKKLSSSLQS